MCGGGYYFLIEFIKWVENEVQLKMICTFYFYRLEINLLKMNKLNYLDYPLMDYSVVHFNIYILFHSDHHGLTHLENNFTLDGISIWRSCYILNEFTLV